MDADTPQIRQGRRQANSNLPRLPILGRYSVACPQGARPSGGRVAVLPAHSHAGRWPASAAAIVASGLALPKLTAHQRQAALARPRAFDVAHEIADDLDLIGLIGRDFNVGELIFDE